MFPVLHVGPLLLRSYPIVVTAGIVFAWFLLLRRTRRLGYATEPVLAWVVLAYPVGALSATALASAVAFGRGEALDAGMSMLGSVAGCVAFSWLYARLVFAEPPWRLLDAVSFSFPLTLAVGRLGCMLNGCCAGIETTAHLWPLSVPTAAYAAGTEAARAHAETGADGWCWNLALLLALASAVVLALLEVAWRLRTQWRLRDGDLLAAWCVLDAATRSPLELLRAEPGGPTHVWGALSALTGLVGVGVLARSWRHRRGETR